MVSVVILTSNEYPQEGLLKNLRDQTYKDFEIIYATEKGIVNAMNIALDKARGDIFVRIDDDVYLPPYWLGELVKEFAFKPDFRPGAINYINNIAGVTGPTFVPFLNRRNRDSVRIAENPNRFLRWLFDNDPYAPAKIYKCGSVSYGSNFKHKMNMYRDYEIDHLEGTNWAMRTELIRRVGGFDPAFDGVAEWFDTDVEFKIKKLGYKIKYNTNAVVYHLLEKGAHYNERFDGFGRIKNWLRFHRRHSKFHYKKIIWLMLMIVYFLGRRK